MSLNRRSVLKGAAASAAAASLPVRASAQAEPIKVGILTPLTGAGGNDGPRMLKAMQAVFEEVNKAGGVLGRQIETVVEDDQTNPEAAVRAARKLIEVDKVPVIMGTWASAVTIGGGAGVLGEQDIPDARCRAPTASRCCRTRAFSSAPSRTPSCRAIAHASFIAGLGKKAHRRDRHPGAVRGPDQGAHRQRTEERSAAASSAQVIYEKDKPTYRSEIDQIMASKPDFLYLNGYAPDTVVVLRDLWKAGVDLPKFAQTYAVPQADARRQSAGGLRGDFYRRTIGRSRQPARTSSPPIGLV